MQAGLAMRGVLVGTVGLAAIGLGPVAANETPETRAQTGASLELTLDDLLDAYLGGDPGIVARTFLGSVDLPSQRQSDFTLRLAHFQRLAEPSGLDRWLGSWSTGKALLLLEMARAANRVAPNYTAGLIGAGRRYVTAAGVPASFGLLWYLAALAVLLDHGDAEQIEAHAAAVERYAAGAGLRSSIDGRLALARGVAQEIRCWNSRPSLEYPGREVVSLAHDAGLSLENGRNGSASADRALAESRHHACLGEALARFQAATTAEEVGAEARVRGGQVLFQLGRHHEALEWLDAASPAGDPDLAYWHSLFRGRVLDALRRFDDAAKAYQAAMSVCPTAQSAAAGLVSHLARVGRLVEAQELKRTLLAAVDPAPDPWWAYPHGDARFLGLWMQRLQAARR